MPDYIPNQDARFNDWQNNFVQSVDQGAEKWGIPETAGVRLMELRSLWVESYAVASNVHGRTQADVLAKNEARAAYKQEIRLFVKRHLAFNEAVTDAERDGMGLTVRTASHTTAPVPATSPVAEVNFSTHLRHIVHFRDSNSTGRAKPEKVHGCEIWTKVGGEPPINELELSYLGVDTHSPYTVVFQGGQQGQTAYYWLRWVNTRGECGPWSAPVGAVIA